MQKSGHAFFKQVPNFALASKNLANLKCCKLFYFETYNVINNSEPL